MTGNKKSAFMRLLAVLLLLPVVSAAVFAANDNEKSFGIDIDMRVPGSNDAYQTQIYLYKAADAEVDETGNLHMKPVKLFEDLRFDGLTQEQIQTLLNELCSRVKYPGSVPEGTPNLTPVKIQKTEEDGKIHFKDLDGGVYLLIKWAQDAPQKLEMMPSLVYLPRFDSETNTWEKSAKVSPKFSWQPDPTPVPPPVPNDPVLPQTGMVQWPAPILVLTGLFLLAIGYWFTRRAKQE